MLAAIQLERGQALIEFAFVVLTMTLITLGVVNFAFALQQGMLLEEAAAAGAVHGAFTNYNSNLSGIPQYVSMVAGGNATNLSVSGATFCTCNGSTVACSSTCNSDRPLLYIKMTTSSSFNSMFQYAGLPSIFNLTNSVVMPVE
jgi:hypothetical protein